MALTIAATATPMFSNPANRTNSATNYTQNYQVLFNGVNTASAADLQIAEALALDAPGVPNIGDNFRANKAAYCNGKSAAARVQGNKPVSVIVTCTYSTMGDPEKDSAENPLDKVPTIVWTPIFEREAITSARQIKIFQDGEPQKGLQVDGKGKGVNNFDLAITNSFGREFQAAPEKEVPYMQWTVTENLAVFDVKLALELLHTVNHIDFKIDGYTIKEGQNLLVQRSATQQFSGKFSYREVTTSGIIKSSHAAQVADNGDFVHNPDTPGAKFNNGKDDGVEGQIDGVHAVVNLDGKGNALKEGQKQVFIHFEVYERQDHNRLKLPTERR